MPQKPESCNSCPLQTISQGFCPDNIPPKAKYLMIGEAPGSTEIVKGKPFVGDAGFVLSNWLMRAVPLLQLASERNEVGYANVLRCLPPKVAGRPYPKGDVKEKAEAQCRQYDAWPDSIHTVILFGEHSQRLYFGEELAVEDAVSRSLQRDVKGVTGRIGRVYERDGKKYIFAPHPAYILRQPALVEHGQQSLRIAVGQDRIVTPDYIKWEDALEQLSDMTRWHI